MKKKEEKELQEKLVAAVKKVLKDNNAILTVKIDKVVKKSIRQIIKKSSKKIAVKRKPEAAKK